MECQANFEVETRKNTKHISTEDRMKAAVFKLPDKAPVIQQKAPRDNRKYATLPRKAVMDKQLRNADIRVLAALCSYTNRAGLCWVSQLRLSEDIGIARQNVNRSIVRLKKLDYLRVQSAHKPKHKGETLQVVFDADITAEDAVAIVSSQEDARSPEMVAADEEAVLKADTVKIHSKGVKKMKTPTEAVIRNHKQIIKNNGKNKKQSMAFLKKHGIEYKKPEEDVGVNTRITSMSSESIGVIPVITDTNHQHDTNEVFNVYINIYSESKSKAGLQYHAGEYDDLLAEQLQRTIDPALWKQFVETELRANPDVPFHRLAEACIGCD